MKNPRTLKSTLAAATIVAAGLAGAATPAHAAELPTIVVDCGSTITILGAVGDTVTLDFSPCAQYDGALGSLALPGSPVTGFMDVAAISGTPVPPGTFQPGWQIPFGSPYALFQPITVMILGVNVEQSALSVGAPMGYYTVGNTSALIVYGGPAPSSGIAPVVQGLPMPASGSCADVRDADYAWGTGLTGGWTKAWELWVDPAGGKGGWACTRALMHSGSVWTIRA
jgi:hypothetical protein